MPTANKHKPRGKSHQRRCQVYRAANIREFNKIKRLARHVKHNRMDKAAAVFLDKFGDRFPGPYTKVKRAFPGLFGSKA